MKEPLYPHVPKRKEPLYPHQAKSQTCKAEIGIPGTRYLTRPCPEPALPGKVYCPLHLVQAQRLEERHQRGLRITEAEIDQIIADLNLLREEKVWIDTFETKGASVIHLQSGETATIIEPPEDFISPNYADRAMQIKWADGSEMVVDSNDFAPSSLQKQIAEITHGKPIPEFPKTEAAKEDAEIQNVLDSGYIQELKTGAWKKQLNEMTDGRYLVEVYWVPWISEVGREDQWEKYFTDQNEAEKFYQSLKTIAQVKKQMGRFSFPP